MDARKIEGKIANFITDLKGKDKSILRTAMTGALSPSDLAPRHRETEEQVAEKIEILFKMALRRIYALSSEEAQNAAIETLWGSIDYMKSANGYSSWYINVSWVDKLKLTKLEYKKLCDGDVLVKATDADPRLTYYVLSSDLSEVRDDLRSKAAQQGLNEVETELFMENYFFRTKVKAREGNGGTTWHAAITPQGVDELNSFFARQDGKKGYIKGVTYLMEKHGMEMATAIETCKKFSVYERDVLYKDYLKTKTEDAVYEECIKRVGFSDERWALTEKGVAEIDSFIANGLDKAMDRPGRCY